MASEEEQIQLIVGATVAGVAVIFIILVIVILVLRPCGDPLQQNTTNTSPPSFGLPPANPANIEVRMSSLATQQAVIDDDYVELGETIHSEQEQNAANEYSEMPEPIYNTVTEPEHGT